MKVSTRIIALGHAHGGKKKNLENILQQYLQNSNQAKEDVLGKTPKHLSVSACSDTDFQTAHRHLLVTKNWIFFLVFEKKKSCNHIKDNIRTKTLVGI